MPSEQAFRRGAREHIGQAVERVFRERLAAALQCRGITQADVAGRMGANPSQVSHWFTGVRVPSARNLRWLGDILDVSVDWLLGRTDAMEAIASPAAPVFADWLALNMEDRRLAAEFIRLLRRRSRTRALAADDRVHGDAHPHPPSTGEGADFGTSSIEGTASALAPGGRPLGDPSWQQNRHSGGTSPKDGVSARNEVVDSDEGGEARRTTR